MTREIAVPMAIVFLAASVTMSASPLLPDTPVAKVGTATIRYGQIAADRRLDAAKRIETEQAELNVRIADAMLDPILAKHGITVRRSPRRCRRS